MRNPTKLFILIIALCVFVTAFFTVCDFYLASEDITSAEPEVPSLSGDISTAPIPESSAEESTTENITDSSETSTEIIETTAEETTATETTEEITETEPIPETTVHSHEFSEYMTIKSPTCEDDGVDQRECACGEIEKRTVSALGHKIKKLSAVAATCKNEGLSEGEQCSRCEKILKKQETVPVTECKYVSSVCKYCGKIDAESVKLTATCAGLYRADTLECLFSLNPDDKVPQASLTKMITACVAIENMPLDHVITIGSEQSLVPKNSSLCYVYKGQKVKLKDILTGMLLCSGNDAAYAVAANVARYASKNNSMTDREAIDYFCDMMNDYAQKIGAQNTCFKTPDGFDENGQYSTVSDLALITAHAMKNETIAKIAATQSVKVIFESGETAKWTNTNELLNPKSSYYTSYVTGFKTGGTVKAGKCLSATFIADGVEYIAIVLGCDDNASRYENILTLINLIK